MYKRQFETDVDGNYHQSEDILEIVPVDDHAAYGRMRLVFSNGDLGLIYGISIYGKNSLIYDNVEKGDRRRVVEYVRSSDEVITSADYDKNARMRRISRRM